MLEKGYFFPQRLLMARPWAVPWWSQLKSEIKGPPPRPRGLKFEEIWGFRKANSANKRLDMGQNLGISFAVRYFTIIKYNTGGALVEWDLKQEDVALCIKSGAY